MSERPVERRQTFVQVGEAFERFLHDVDLGRQELTENPGRGTTTLDLGMLTFRKRAATLGLSTVQLEQAEAEARRQFRKGTALCESPIERDALAALILAPWAGFGTIPPLVHDAKADGALPAGDIVIVPQMAFVRFRLDFAVVVEIGGVRRIVALECDGEEYHQDHLKDEARDDYLKSWQVPVFRVRGKDLHTEADDAIRAAVNHVNDLKALE